MRRQSLGNRRFVEAILCQRPAHLLQRLGQLGRGKTRAGRELAGALQLRIHGGALGAVHADGPDKCTWRPAKNQVNALLPALPIYLDILVKTGGKELAQTALQLFPVQRPSLGLGQVAGQRGQPAGRNPLEGDAPHRQALPLGERIPATL